MKDKTATILRIFLSVLLVISLIMFVLFYAVGEDYTSMVLTWAYILLALTLAITIIFPIINFITNPKKGKAVLIGLLGFVVLYLIAYSMSSGNVSGDIYEKFNITAAVSRFIGAMLLMTYFLGGIALLSVIYSGISGFFK